MAHAHSHEEIGQVDTQEVPALENQNKGDEIAIKQEEDQKPENTDAAKNDQEEKKEEPKEEAKVDDANNVAKK